jgi:hypothetical protein
VLYQGKLFVGGILSNLYVLARQDGRLIGRVAYDTVAIGSGVKNFVDTIGMQAYMAPPSDEVTGVALTPQSNNGRLYIPYRNGVVAALAATP